MSIMCNGPDDPGDGRGPRVGNGAEVPRRRLLARWLSRELHPAHTAKVPRSR
jgi:hypothetical protein